MISDKGGDDKLFIGNSVDMDVGDGDIDILGIGVRLEFDYDIKASIDDCNVFIIYDGNGSLDGGIWLCTNHGSGLGTDDGDGDGDGVVINNGYKVGTTNSNGVGIDNW